MRLPVGLIALIGCTHATPARAPQATTTTLALPGGRIAVVHVPGRIGALPLVVSLHASGATAALHEQLTNMDVVADREGFVVVYPQALMPKSDGFEWHLPGQPLSDGGAEPSAAPDDVGDL